MASAVAAQQRISFEFHCSPRRGLTFRHYILSISSSLSLSLSRSLSSVCMYKTNRITRGVGNYTTVDKDILEAPSSSSEIYIYIKNIHVQVECCHELACALYFPGYIAPTRANSWRSCVDPPSLSLSLSLSAKG